MKRTMLAIILASSIAGLGMGNAHADNEGYYQVTQICQDSATLAQVAYDMMQGGETESQVLAMDTDNGSGGNQDARDIGNEVAAFGVQYVFHHATSRDDAGTATLMKCMDLFRSYE